MANDLPPPKRRGRPRSSMTPEAIAAILRAVRCGLHIEVASRIAGVAPSTVRSHRGRHRDFDEALLQAEATCEGSLVAIINRSAANDWHAASWLLERSRPDRWARPEIRQQLLQVNISANDVVDGIHRMLKIVARQHADFSQPDVEDLYGLPPADPGQPDPLPALPPSDPSAEPAEPPPSSTIARG